jgi:hypothetical protein
MHDGQPRLDDGFVASPYKAGDFLLRAEGDSFVGGAYGAQLSKLQPSAVTLER